jgi:DNA invertase Pin-like site-specific DNA recombinase
MCTSCTTGGKPVAALWARVSTRDQVELSPEGQVSRVRPMLESKGYVVPDGKVLKVTWSSMELLHCPEMAILRRWIRQGEINAIGVLDRDRLAAQDMQRLMFLSDCQEYGVTLFPYQGAPVLEGAEGRLVELALAMHKEQQVLRARQGAKDGMKDRAKLHGLPPAAGERGGKAPFPYHWDNQKRAYVAGDGYKTARQIVEAYLGGASLQQLVNIFKGAGAPLSRSHMRAWLWNPILEGRVYALRYERVVPKKRLQEGYGKSSAKVRNPADWVPL